MKLEENIVLAPLTTFGVGGPARYFVNAATQADVLEALRFTRERDLPLFVLGGGSNLVVADAGFRGLVMKIGSRGIVERESGKQVIFEVAAGEDWDAFVALSVARDCAGIETLSGIPGSVGGTPVQNVGAYGEEVAETITSVRALEIASMSVRDLSNAECGFTYRTSIFNSTERGKYIVLRVTFALERGGKGKVVYADLKKRFASHSGTPSLLEVREAVREIRHSKGMLIVENDPDCRSAGSFFKNPIVANTEYERIAQLARDGAPPPKYPADEGRVKLSAAWLVEHSGFHKGYSRARVGISNKHTLAIINRGGATAAEIMALKEEVQSGVRKRFGIELQPEPVFLGFDSNV
jgi:UDP-N-acetylmuramate dehydrogenase